MDGKSLQFFLLNCTNGKYVAYTGCRRTETDKIEEAFNFGSQHQANCLKSMLIVQHQIVERDFRHANYTD